jgi:putative ABC transport system permease protein
MTLVSLLRHISLKHLILKKTQTFMAIFGICLGVAAMVSIDIVNASVLRSFEESINHITGRAVLQVTGAESGFPEQMLDRIQNVDGVEYAVPVIETNANLAQGSERAFAVLGVDVLQDNNIRDYSVRDESAEIPDPLLFLARPDSILLTREMASREGLKIDQKIRVQTVQGIKTFTIRGLLDPDGPAKAMGGDIAVMDLYAAEMAFGKDGRIDRIDVSIQRGQSIDTVKDLIQKALPDGYNVDTPLGRSKQIENLMGRFRKSMDVISFMALFVGMYLIYNAVSISVVQRRKEIGILRALGATRAHIVTLFLGETVVIALVASLLGAGLGYLFAKLSIATVAQSVSDMYGRASADNLEFSLFHFLKNACIGIGASILAATLPARSTTRIAPVSAIRSLPFSPDGIVLKRAVKIAALFLVSLSGLLLLMYKTADRSSEIRSSATTTGAMMLLVLGVSLSTPVFLQWFIRLFHRNVAPRLGVNGRLAGLNLEKNISRNAVAVGAVFFSICLSVSSSSMIFSAKQALLDYIDSVERSDILITAGHPLASAGAHNIPMPGAMKQEIEQVPGVASADPFRKLFINLAGRRVLLETIDTVRWLEHNTCSVMEGRFEDIGKMLPDRDTVAVNEAFADRYRLKPGDSLNLPTPSGPRPFQLVAVIVSYASDSGVIIMDSHTYQRHWQDGVADMFSIYVKPGETIATVREAIRERFSRERKLFILPSQEFRAEIKNLLDRSFVMNNAVNVLTLIIAGFGIIVTLLASVFERTREIGLLRAIGMKRSQVSVLVITESLILGAAGGLLGSATGVMAGWINLEGFFRIDFGASISYQIHYVAVAWAMLLSAGLSVLAGFYPAKRAAKTNIVEALSYE